MMAEILIMMRTGLHPESYQPGDPVCVKPDGWQWGGEEKDPQKFLIVKFPGEDPKAFADFEDEDSVEVRKNDEPIEWIERFVRRRQWKYIEGSNDFLHKQEGFRKRRMTEDEVRDRRARGGGKKPPPRIE